MSDTKNKNLILEVQAPNNFSEVDHYYQSIRDAVNDWSKSNPSSRGIFSVILKGFTTTPEKQMRDIQFYTTPWGDPADTLEKELIRIEGKLADLGYPEAHVIVAGGVK